MSDETNSPIAWKPRDERDWAGVWLALVAYIGVIAVWTYAVVAISRWGAS